MENNYFKTIEVKENDSLILNFLYNHLLGRFFLKGMIQAPVTKLTGRYLNSSFSKRMIKRFIQKNQLDMEQYKTTTYTSFNDFFIREINSQARPVPSNEELLAAPCDGKVTVYPITEGNMFQIKRSNYLLAELFESSTLAKKWYGGTAVVFRLTPDDYHHYYYIDEGIISEQKQIKGVFHTVRPIAINNVPVFSRNSREVTIIETENFGEIAQIEVGALMVGKINNLKTQGTCQRFEKKGWFEFGGSTVILLFQENTVELFPEFLENTKNKLETVVKFGEVIGKKIGAANE